MTLYHFSGAGNNFILLDGRGEDCSAFRTPARIVSVCSQYHTDGLMILGAAIQSTHPVIPSDSPVIPSDSPVIPSEAKESILPSFHGLSVESSIDFVMEFFNPDGTGGMMCGNGGRCITAFADMLGIKPAEGRIYHFLAPDGPHTSEILSKDGPDCWVIRLHMKDVSGITPVLGGYFLDTGTRHYVRFVPDTESIDINTEGPRYRHDPAFAPIGANANFVERRPDGVLRVRTFEKGVEGETLACGTGITASALAAWYDASLSSEAPSLSSESPSLSSEAPPLSFRAERRNLSTVHTPIRARQDDLCVDFTPTGPSTFTSVYLTGPATLLAKY